LTPEGQAVRQALEEAARLRYSPDDPLPYYDFIADHLLRSEAFYSEEHLNNARAEAEAECESDIADLEHDLVRLRDALREVRHPAAGG